MTGVEGVILAGAGVLAGFVDSIAGGGGLITLPSLSVILGAGPHSIGTNKIVGAIAAFVALLVYLRQGHMDWRRSLIFALWIGLGSLAGSFTAPHLPIGIFKWLLAVTCPLILWVVWRKDLWVAREAKAKRHFGTRSTVKIAAAGLACGFYDGVWGPGGGTFMFLALLFVVELPTLTALAAAKFANACSASVALVGYSVGGYVHWFPGLVMAAGVSLGAYSGASYANRATSRVIRPVLAVVAILLIVRLFK